MDKNAKKVQLSAVQKRMFMSPSSPLKKASTKNMNKQRSDKQITSTAFEANDE